MTTLTIEIPETLDNQLSQAAERTSISKAALAKRALKQFLTKQPDEPATTKTVADVAGHLFGSIDGNAPADLSTNKEYFENYGK